MRKSGPLKRIRYIAIIAAGASLAACQTVTQFVDSHLDTNLTGTFLHSKRSETSEPQPGQVASAHSQKPPQAEADKKSKNAIASVNIPMLRGEVEVSRSQPIVEGLQPDDLRAPFGN